jgi:hypothetical protein
VQLRKISPPKRASLYAVVLSLSFIFAWQVSVHAATTVTFGDNSGDTFNGNVEDALIREVTSFYNYGGMATIPVGEEDELGVTSRSLIRFKDIFSSLPDGAVITSATMYLYCSSEDSTTDHSVSAYRVLLDWGEGDGLGAFGFNVCSWNYAQYTGIPWNTYGCDAADDGTGEDGLADRRATAEAGTLITGTGWFAWDLTAAVQNWYNGQWSEYGVILINDDEGTLDSRKVFDSREGTDGQRPYLSITYDVGAPATTSYIDSAHGDDTFGVFRRPESAEFPLGVDCTQWPGGTCVGTKGSCAHCHDTFDPDYCGVNTLMLFAGLDYDSQWDSFCISCHKGPASSIQDNMPNQYTYSVNRGGAPTGCPTNIRGSFRFVDETGQQRDQCGSTVGSSHFLADIRDSLAGKWGFDADPAKINACHACHNPHLAMQDYPASRPSDHGGYWEVWGDEAGEKMTDNWGTYYPPYKYPFPVGTEPPELYIGLPPPQTHEWGPAGTYFSPDTPDYITLCLDCHQDAQYSTRLSRNLKAINWENGDRHGEKGEVGYAQCYYGFLKAPYENDCFGTISQYKVVMCTDCHDPHGSPNEFLLRTCANGHDGLSVPGPGEWWDFCQACHYLTYGSHYHSESLTCPECHGHGENTPFGEGF